MPEEIRADLLLGRDTLSPGLVKAGRAASDASSNVRQLTRDLYEAGKQRATPVVDLNDKDATAKLTDVTAKLKELGARVADPKVSVDDKKALASVADMRVKLDALGKKVSSPRITLEGLTRAEAGILRIDAMLDELDRKHASATVGVHRSLLGRIGGGIGGLLGGAGSLAGSGASAIGGGIGGVGNAFGQVGQALQGIGLAGLIGTGVALSPALLPLLLGGGVGAGAAGGAFALGSSADQQLTTLQKALQTASGKRKRQIEQQITALRQSKGPELGAFGGLENIGTTALGVFSGALTSTGRGFSGGGPGGTQNASFLTGLNGILKQIGGFIKTIGPQLGDMFRASIPYLQTFVKFLERAAKELLPAFTKMLVEFQPYLPAIFKGLNNIVKGMVGFLNAIGPSGMKAAARIFVVLTEGMAGALVALGHTINWLTENIPTWIRKIHNEWDVLRHETAVIFDGIRHDIAHYWDLIFENSVGRVIRGGHDIEREYNTWRHNIAAIFDAFRHSTAVVWDAIWNNTIGRTRAGIGDVVGWFKRLPGEVIHALFGLGHQLYAFAHAALNEMWSGFKSIAGSILSWIGNFVKSIWSKVKSFFGINSPSSLFYDIGKNLMLGLFHGIKDHAHHAATAARGATGAVSGALGGDAAANMALARRMFPWPASMWPAFYNLEMREAGFDRFARNQSSGAYGIPQALPESKLPFAGQAAGGSHAGAQLSWMFSYIAQRYGNPLNAWAHEAAAGWYGSGLNAIVSKPTLIGVGERGPERVSVVPLSGPRHGGGGVTNYVTVQVGHGTHPVAAAQELVKLLNQGAHLGGVKLRSSILGPG